MSMSPRALIVDTNAERASALQQLLTSSGFDVLRAAEVAEAVALLGSTGVDVVLAALRDTESQARLQSAMDTAWLIVCCDAKRWVEWIERASGSYDVLPFDAAPARVLHAVDRAVREVGHVRELAQLRARHAPSVDAMLVGRSSAMAQLRELIGRAAASQRTVLVTGEAGVGKDLVARLVHELSPRAARPFVGIRCADVDAAALEEELFGVDRSVLRSGRTGLFETAGGGTIVLDECDALTPALRARVAQAIVERTATRVGGQMPVSLDVRVVLTTRGAWDDSLPGVSVLPIAIPALRDRRSDIPLLVQHFRARITREQGSEPRALAPDALMSLLAQQWPGNVRELEHRVQRDAAGGADVAAPSRAGGPMAASIPADARMTLDELERKYIEHVLAQEGGNQSRAAERLGIDRRTLYRKLKEYRV
ncbi:MAG: sigma 54-interacting transcriptional regulator [Gemmatimonadaceae bacterium]